MSIFEWLLHASSFPLAFTLSCTPSCIMHLTYFTKLQKPGIACVTNTNLILVTTSLSFQWKERMAEGDWNRNKSSNANKVSIFLLLTRQSDGSTAFHIMYYGSGCHTLRFNSSKNVMVPIIGWPWVHRSSVCPCVYSAHAYPSICVLKLKYQLHTLNWTEHEMMRYSIIMKTIIDNHSDRYPYFSKIILHCMQHHLHCNHQHGCWKSSGARSDLVQCNFQPNTLMYYSSTATYPLYINDIVQEICVVFGLHWHYRRRWGIPYFSQFKICFLLYQGDRYCVAISSNLQSQWSWSGPSYTIFLFMVQAILRHVWTLDILFENWEFSYKGHLYIQSQSPVCPKKQTLKVLSNIALNEDNWIELKQSVPYTGKK